MARTDAPTAEFDLSVWVPPVETRDDLWSFARDGQLCFVKDEGRIYQRHDRQWIPHQAPRRRSA